MNDPHDYDHGHDQNHDFGDAQLSAIYRQSRVEQPPMKLDSAILSEGRNAVAKKVKWWRTSWIAPIATASVAVLAVTIGMMNKSMVEKQERFMEPAADSMTMEDKPERMLEKARDTEKKTPLSKAPATPSASGAAQPASEEMEQEGASIAAQATAPKIEQHTREVLAPEPQYSTNEMDARKGLAGAADEAPEPSGIAKLCPSSDFRKFLDAFTENENIQRSFTHDPVVMLQLDDKADPEPTSFTRELKPGQISFPVIPPLAERDLKGLSISVDQVAESNAKITLFKEDTGWRVHYLFEKGECWQLVRIEDRSM